MGSNAEEPKKGNLFKINSTEKIKEMSEKYFGHRQLPPYLLTEGEYAIVAVGMDRDASNGLAYGVVPHGTEKFILHFLYVKPAFRNQETVLCLLECILKEAADVDGVTGAIWKYELGIDEADVRAKLLALVPFCRVGELRKSRHYRIKTEDIDFIRQQRIYKPQLWKTKCYEVQRLLECKISLFDEISYKEKNGLLGEDYISIFDKSGSIKQDEYNSFILSKDGIPIGWIVCSTESISEITIEKFYVYPDVRSARIAHSFSTYVLDVLSNEFEYLSFNVEFGNRQMEKIAKMYFEPILESCKVLCGLEINF